MGHVSSGRDKNSGPLNHVECSCNSDGCFPLVIQSAGFISPATHAQQLIFPLVAACISDIRSPSYNLNLVLVFCSIDKTVSLSTMCNTLVNLYLDSFSITSLPLLLITAAFNSNCGVDLLTRGATLPLDITSLVLYVLSLHSQRTYPQNPQARSLASLNRISIGSPIASLGFIDLGKLRSFALYKVTK